MNENTEEMEVGEGDKYAFIQDLDQGIRKPGTGPFYLCGLLLVSIAMIALPLIYLGLTGLAGWGLYHHAVHHFEPIMSWGSNHWRLMILKFFAYAAPLVIGAIVLFFMFKPLLARQPKRARPLALNPGAEPVLYAFVDAVCRAVGAPMPQRIDLNCDLNAAAGFRRGFLSYLGNDLVLVIGLPLAGNLTVSQLAGVLAHEFGHFAQGFGMRLSYMIYRINGWFARVVYQRDSFDVWLDETAEQSESWWELILYNCARLGVSLSRFILGILMYTGHAISGFMSRQMEYNADLNEIRLVGGDGFESTTRRMEILSVALERLYREMRTQWNGSRTLPADLPRALSREFDRLPAGVIEKIDSNLGMVRSGAFSTHPSPADRIREARRAGEPGIFFDDRPATVLFQCFPVVSRQVTHVHYIDDLGIPIRPGQLEALPGDEAGEPGTDVGSDSSDIADVCMGLGPIVLPFTLEQTETLLEPEEIEQRMARLDEQLESLEPQLRSLGGQYAEHQHALTKLKAGECLRSCGLEAPEEIDVSEAELEESIEGLRLSLREVQAAMQERFDLSVQRARIAGELDEEGEKRLRQLTAEHSRWKEAEAELAMASSMTNLLPENGESSALFRQRLSRVKQLVTGNAVVQEAATTTTGLQLRDQRKTVSEEMMELRASIRKPLNEYAARLAALWNGNQR